jgi:hypothetical protein
MQAIDIYDENGELNGKGRLPAFAADGRFERIEVFELVEFEDVESIMRLVLHVQALKGLEETGAGGPPASW